jgi:thiol:disulfide interchange protein DsbD
MLSIQGDGLGPETVREAWFIPDTADQIRNDAPQNLRVMAGGFTLSLRPGATAFPDRGLSGLVSIRDRTGQQANVVIQATPDRTGAGALAWWQVVALAFLGGSILNLMPCVFPVLAMKALSLAQASMRGAVRAHALSYTAGVVTSFAMLGGVLVAMRAAGMAVGWGFQFQSFAFVAVMAWLLFVIGLNLSGVFQVGTSIAGAGDAMARRGGHAGSFATGLLAVLVATPCTAPFMGTAIAVALAEPLAMTILIFVAMGLGLAAPYVALACAPSLIRLAPRPGPWMEIVKQVLAFPMFGASVWLLWVAAQAAGPDGVLVTAAGYVLLGFAFWGLGRSQYSVGPNRFLGRGVLALGLAGTVALLAAHDPGPSPPSQAATAEDAWSADRLDALRRAGRPVFVNMTAAWCVTCLINERVALRTEATRAAFAAAGVTYLKGDWTRQDPAISAYLAAFGRDGVPLYVYYPPAGAAPVVLAQILTQAAVLAALEPG